MSVQQMPEQPPPWDTADRMRKALRHADLGVGQMAEWLGVGPNTVSTWINGRIHPSKQTLRLWALRCGVPFEWLIGETREGVQSGPVVRKSAFPVRVAWASAA